MIANILTIAGSDSGGGAGIQADLKAISATGAYGLSVITALTAQNTVGVDAIYPIAIEFLQAQMHTVARDIRIDAVKVGMLGTPEVTLAVAEFLRGLECPIVVDPVMVAKSGDRLLHADAVSAMREALLPLATVITPNLPEAADLLGQREAETEEAMMEQAAALLGLGVGACVLKGGHLPAEDSPDLLHLGATHHWFAAPRVATANTHGTGCSLSSALASYLGQGLSTADAFAEAKRYIQGAIAHADQLDVGHGHGPVHHFWKLWGSR